MTKLLDQALREVQQPSPDQNAAAGALLDYVKHMRDAGLTDAQAEEVHRRRTDPDRKIVRMPRRGNASAGWAPDRGWSCFPRSALADIESIQSWISQDSSWTAKLSSCGYSAASGC
jgi:hypothetical protein